MSDLDHEQYRTWSAAYMLGALSRTERATFQAHLERCAACQAEVADFAPLPGLLKTVTDTGADSLGASASAGDGRGDVQADASGDNATGLVAGAVARAHAARRAERRRLRTWQAAAAVAGLAAVVSTSYAAGAARSSPASDGSTSVAATVPGGGGSAASTTAPANPPAGVTVALRADSPGAAGTVVVVRKGWGTELSIDASGLPPREAYTLWAVARDGTRQTAAMWGPTASGRTRCTGATSIPTDKLAAIEIGDGSGVILHAETA